MKAYAITIIDRFTQEVCDMVAIPQSEANNATHAIELTREYFSYKRNHYDMTAEEIKNFAYYDTPDYKEALVFYWLDGTATTISDANTINAFGTARQAINYLHKNGYKKVR